VQTQLAVTRDLLGVQRGGEHLGAWERGPTARTYLYLKAAADRQMDLDAITSCLALEKDVLQT